MIQQLYCIKSTLEEQIFSRQNITEDKYKNCINYMIKAGDLGRESIPLWVWLILLIIGYFVYILFGNMLAGYAIPSINEKIQNITGIAISVLVTINLLDINLYGDTVLT